MEHVLANFKFNEASKDLIMIMLPNWIFSRYEFVVQAKLILGGLSLCQNVKVPFVLLPPHISDDTDPYPSPKAKVSRGISPAVPEQRDAESLRHGNRHHQEISSPRQNETSIEL
jgi:hypothetical protein